MIDTLSARSSALRYASTEEFSLQSNLLKSGPENLAAESVTFVLCLQIGMARGRAVSFSSVAGERGGKIFHSIFLFSAPPVGRDSRSALIITTMFSTCLLIACSKRSDSRERRELGKRVKTRGAWGEGPSIFPRFFRLLFSAPLPHSSRLSPLSERLEQVTYCLNAWNRLPTIWTPGTG